MDKLYTRYVATQFIQKFYRGHMARKRVRMLRVLISTLIFQKYTRRWLAKRELVRLRQNRASIKIQTKARVILAKNELARRKAAWVLAQKIYVCTQIQSHYRRKKAIRLRRYLKKVKCATMIQ